MATVKVSGKLNALKTKEEVERRLALKIEDLQRILPQLDRMFKDGTISIETKVVIKKTTKPRLIFSEKIDDEDIGSINSIAQKYVQGSMCFYDGVSMKLEAGEEPAPEPEVSEFELTITETEPTLPKSILDQDVSVLDPSVRLHNCLDVEGIKTVGELVQKTADDLLEMRNFGPTCLEQVRESLGKLGLKLKGG